MRPTFCPTCMGEMKLLFHVQYFCPKECDLDPSKRTVTRPRFKFKDRTWEIAERRPLVPGFEWPEVGTPCWYIFRTTSAMEDANKSDSELAQEFEQNGKRLWLHEHPGWKVDPSHVIIQEPWKTFRVTHLLIFKEVK